MRGEQSVKSVDEALAIKNKDEIVGGKVSVPAGVPKLGAATADVKDSTSYGLFGINNIRGKDKKGNITPSSIDSFVRMSPQLGLPTPGDNTDPAATKKFNEAWWKVSKENPQGMLKAQLDYFKESFENPAVKKIQDLPDIISKNPGVQLYMTDRRIQYGGALLNSAIDYAKKAKTPEEFIKLISEFDRSHLRVQNEKGEQVGIFAKNTSDDEYKKLVKGLNNRIDTRIKLALAEAKNNGDKLNQSSQENKDLKNNLNEKSQGSNSTTNIIQQPSKNDNRPPENANDENVLKKKGQERK